MTEVYLERHLQFSTSRQPLTMRVKEKSRTSLDIRPAKFRWVVSARANKWR